MKKNKVPPPPAKKGNTYAKKLKDAEMRQEAFRQYCEHLSKGYPKESFFFDHPTHSVCWKTIERYLRENPSEFPSILIEKAKACSYKTWFSEGIALMKGKYKGGSPVVWQTIMRNKFRDIGWDREQINETNKSHVESLAESIRNEVVAETEISDSEIKQTD